jgi:Uma2 family endonuclease
MKTFFASFVRLRLLLSAKIQIPASTVDTRMLDYTSFHHLPSAEELPSSDDTPVDNELQNLIPNLLSATLAIIWAERMDWFFGVDMGIYYIPNQTLGSFG